MSLLKRNGIKEKAPQRTATPEKMNSDEKVGAIYKQWATVVNNPDEWLKDLSGEIAFTAGAGLTLLFGKKDSDLWKDIEKSAKNGAIEIAGISFSLKGLALIGDFYRFLRDLSTSLMCIDERLTGILADKGKLVHEECGACGAVHGAITEVTQIADMEEYVLKQLGQESGKQKIYSEMKNHRTITIFVDFHGDEAVADEGKRRALMQNDALPFQVSLPVKRIEEFISSRNLKRGEADLLLATLVNWNVKIARNIIGGSYNDLNGLAGHTLVVMDTRQVSRHNLTPQLLSKIDESVNPKRKLFIK